MALRLLHRPFIFVPALGIGIAGAVSLLLAVTGRLPNGPIVLPAQTSTTADAPTQPLGPDPGAGYEVPDEPPADVQSEQTAGRFGEWCDASARECRNLVDPFGSNPDLRDAAGQWCSDNPADCQSIPEGDQPPAPDYPPP
jgi:hypothetical protein